MPARRSTSKPCRSKGQRTRAMSKISTQAAQGTHGKTELSGRPFAPPTRGRGPNLMKPSCAGRLGTNRATTQKLVVARWRLGRQWQQAPRRRLAPRSTQRQQAPAAVCPSAWQAPRWRLAPRSMQRQQAPAAAAMWGLPAAAASRSRFRSKMDQNFAWVSFRAGARRGVRGALGQGVVRESGHDDRGARQATPSESFSGCRERR